MKVRFDIGVVASHETDQPVPGLLTELLRLVKTEGSLSAAAQNANVSYRKAWNLMNYWTEKFGNELIDARRGHGASLTSFGDGFLKAIENASRETAEARALTAKQFTDRWMPPEQSDSNALLNIMASHCLSHNLLRELYRTQGNDEVHIAHNGSGGSLRQLVSGECDAAGFHLADGALRQLFRDSYKGLIDTADIQLIEAVKRRQGLMVRKGNPKNILQLSDLTRPNIQMVNRQPNSGTRLLLDMLLHQAHIEAQTIAGYDNEEFTHSAVSALVAGGAADVAIGTEASAVQLDLEFLPLLTETYYYAVRRDSWNLSRVQTLVRVLSGDSWKARIHLLDGYDAKHAGTVCSAEQVLG